MNGKHLVTCDSWFYGPDGQQYKAVYGDVEVVNDSVLGIKTNSRSSNWFIKVGSKDRYIIIAGCQIHYAIRTDERPSEQELKTEEYYEGKVVNNKVPSRIYFFD